MEFWKLLRSGKTQGIFFPSLQMGTLVGNVNNNNNTYYELINYFIFSR